MAAAWQPIRAQGTDRAARIVLLIGQTLWEALREHPIKMFLYRQKKTTLGVNARTVFTLLFVKTKRSLYLRWEPFGRSGKIPWACGPFPSVLPVFGIYVTREVLVQKYEQRLTIRTSCRVGAPLACLFEEFTMSTPFMRFFHHVSPFYPNFSLSLSFIFSHMFSQFWSIINIFLFWLVFVFFVAYFWRFFSVSSVFAIFSSFLSVFRGCLGQFWIIPILFWIFGRSIFLFFRSVRFFSPIVNVFLGLVLSWYFCHSWSVCSEIWATLDYSYES